MQYVQHVIAIYPHHHTRCNGGCSGHADSPYAGDGLFANKVSRGKEAHGCFFAGLGDNCELGAAGAQIEDRIGSAALSKEG